MHEMSIAADLIAIIQDVAQQNQAKVVTRAIVEVGALSGIEPDALDFAFEVVRRDTVAHDCMLELKHVPLTARCSQCGWRGEVARDAPICPTCDALSLEVLTGREMRLVSIDIDDEENSDA